VRIQLLIVTGLALVGLDQLTKALATHYIGPGKRIPVLPGFFDLVLWKNTGAAFGFLSGLPSGRWLLIGLTVVALAVAVWVMLTQDGRSHALFWCLTLICGGAVGNLIDRLRTGLVVDFLLVYHKDWYWPAFNLADSAISVGGTWLALLLLRGK
jgi:signal peptidase II